MAVGERQPLAVARRVADRFSQALAPACERIELAGSIRRCKETVGDIEIVAIPRFRQEEGPKPDLFNPAPVHEVSLVWEAISEMGPEVCQPIRIEHWSRKRLRGEARYLKLWLPRSGFRVDLFLATPETWGVIFAIRTGSSDFSRALVTRWTVVTGGHSKDGRLCDRDGNPLSTPEERDVFDLCRVKYIAPPLRLDASSLEPIQ